MPNGEDIGYALGDVYRKEENATQLPFTMLSHRTSANKEEILNLYNLTDPNTSQKDGGITPHPWGVLFTILGTVLLDFDADACQSPARAYLLDVTLPGEFY